MPRLRREVGEMSNEPLTIQVEVGDNSHDYSIGDYLNAIDAVTCYYDQFREQSPQQMAAALRLYAEGIDNHV